MFIGRRTTGEMDAVKQRRQAAKRILILFPDLRLHDALHRTLPHAGYSYMEIQAVDVGQEYLLTSHTPQTMLIHIAFASWERSFHFLRFLIQQGEQVNHHTFLAVFEPFIQTPRALISTVNLLPALRTCNSYEPLALMQFVRQATRLSPRTI